jgi:PPK2 family polyphosphate:nucleotide phosphotransferase
MFKAPESPYLVPFDGTFSIADMPHGAPKGAGSKEDQRHRLERKVQELSELQGLLYAHDHHSVLLIFQAMDAAGKDGTIKALLSGVNPVGCQVYSFKQPSKEELDHDFLWRTARCLPERGRIGVFNRSYYEEALVVRVHPEYLGGQRIPASLVTGEIWEERLKSMRDHERHLARNGTIVLKFFLNVSKEEQRKRFLARLQEPEKNWKFSTGDVSERDNWEDYMAAYEAALAANSKPWAPWYCIPADNKAYMRTVVAELVVEALRSLDLAYPVPGEEDRRHFAKMEQLLLSQAPSSDEEGKKSAKSKTAGRKSAKKKSAKS